MAATISYRLSGEAKFPAQIHDCKAAVRFLRAHADEYGIDADHIGAIGLSAGGHLTALLATSGGVADLEGNGGSAGSSSLIQAAIPMGAQTDFLSERTQEVSAAEPKGVIWQQFLGGTQEERPAVYKAASPLTYLDAGDPPCWFIAGEHDDASTHADAFREQMKQHGISSGLTVINDARMALLENKFGLIKWLREQINFLGTVSEEKTNTMLYRLIVSVGCVLVCAVGLAAEKPNVLFLAVDDMNDWIGCLDSVPQAITPNLNRLAARGVNFTNAHTAGVF